MGKGAFPLMSEKARHACEKIAMSDFDCTKCNPQFARNAGIQHRKSLDSSLRHAGMTCKWDSSGWREVFPSYLRHACEDTLLSGIIIAK